MARNGQQVPLELEEQGLRYALTIAPDDTGMWLRYIKVIKTQGKPITPQIEANMMLAVLAVEPSRSDLKDRLSVILEVSGSDLSEDIRARAITLATTTKTAAN